MPLSFDITILIRFILAVVLGATIGLERELTNKYAGLRTNILVCLGSCVFTILSIYAFPLAADSVHPQAFGDPARIAAQILTGIGFIGGGTVLRHGASVYGLTTAATLWVTAALGISLGAGMLFAGTLSFVLIMLTIGVFSHFSKYISKHNRIISIYVEIDKDYDLDLIMNFIKEKDYRVVSMEKKKKKIAKNCDLSVTLEIDMKSNLDHDNFLNDVGSLNGILYVEEIVY